MLRSLLAGVLVASAAFAHRVVQAPLDELLICYEDHPSRTIVRYAAGNWIVLLLDADKSGSLEAKDDRVIAYNDRVMYTHYPDGILESRLVEHDGEFFIGTERFFGAYYRGDEMILENEADREGYAAARSRFASESVMLARIAESFADHPHAWLATCDPHQLLGRQ